MIDIVKSKAGAISMVAMTSLAVIPGVAAADEIILSLPDNTLRLYGQFVGFDQNAYVVEIAGNEIRVPVGLMICEGPDCLDFQPISETQG